MVFDHSTTPGQGILAYALSYDAVSKMELTKENRRCQQWRRLGGRRVHRLVHTSTPRPLLAHPQLRADMAYSTVDVALLRDISHYSAFSAT